MADFSKAISHLLKYEGTYSNDPEDKGGETFCGIARKFNPNWAGWKIVDSYRDKRLLFNNTELMALVKLFYKEEYWNYFYLDNLQFDLIAIEIFEGSVNLGKSSYCLLLWTVINLLNRNGKLYSDVKVKNSFNREDLSILDYSIRANGQKLFYNVLNFMQARHYLNLMLSNPVNEKWIGWFNRIDIVK